MSEYVVDTSTMVKALAYKDAVGVATYRQVTKATCYAPYLVDAEFGQVMRRGERVGDISEDTARTALAALPAVIDIRYPHTGRFTDLAWQTRHTISFYDGLYVALATVLDLPLLTADVKLSKAPGLTCQVELVGAGTP